jgi:hypothetical protein
MKYILAAAAALLPAMNQPSMAYPTGNIYGQPSTPYGQPWGQSRQEQETRNLQQEVYNLKDQRMKNCVNSGSTYCGWDKGRW